MQTAELKPGDGVRLKSGGDVMNVNSVLDGRVECVWFDEEQEFHRQSFAVDELQAVA